MKNKTLFATAIFVSASVQASGPTEIRILGPAFSYHADEAGARRFDSKAWLCRAQYFQSGWYSGQSPPHKTFVVSGVDVPKLAVFDYLGPSRVYSSVELSDQYNVFADVGTTVTQDEQFRTRTLTVGQSVKCERFVEVIPRWMQNNPAIGVEYSFKNPMHTDRVFATFVRDSYGEPGFMLGVARLWPLGGLGTFHVAGGATAGLWHRTTLLDTNELKRTTAPFLMPAITINDAATGIGLNLALAPKVKVFGVQAPTWTVMAQFTYLLSKSQKANSTSFGFDVNPERVALNIGHAF